MPVPRDRVPDLLLAVIVPLPAPQVAVPNPVVHRGVVQELRLLLDVLPRLLGSSSTFSSSFSASTLYPQHKKGWTQTRGGSAFWEEGKELPFDAPLDSKAWTTGSFMYSSTLLGPPTAQLGARLGRVHGGSHGAPLHRLRREGPLRLSRHGRTLLADLAQKRPGTPRNTARRRSGRARQGLLPPLLLLTSHSATAGDHACPPRPPRPPRRSSGPHARSVEVLLDCSMLALQFEALLPPHHEPLPRQSRVSRPLCAQPVHLHLLLPLSRHGRSGSSALALAPAATHQPGGPYPHHTRRQQPARLFHLCPTLTKTFF